MRRVFVVLVALIFPAMVVASPGSRHPAIAAAPPAVQYLHVCGAVPRGFARCHAILRIDPNGNGNSHKPPTSTPVPTSATTPTSTATKAPTSTATTGPTATATSPPGPTPTSTAGGPFTCTASAPSSTTPGGYGPSDLQSAYNLASVADSAGGGCSQTVAIVDAYDDPNAESDLGVYRSRFGLQACTTANGCFRKVNQTGGISYPLANGGWAQEISLDLDMVSAICPNCHILLVEASSNSFANLGTAVNEAVALGANTVSNSYGGTESSISYASYYDHPGHVITASSGDGGYGVEAPASYSQVTAVGGTSLTRSGNAWTESVWNGAGSGCSAYTSQPSWQSSVSNITGKCSNRAVVDVSAVADPNTGVAVYDSYAYQGYSGWLIFGGTSVASPIIASVYALAGNAGSVNYGSYPYSHTAGLNDVTSGSNGSCGNLLCNGATGWDGPTGLGTPNGTGAF